MTIDNSRLRASTACPICVGPKDLGLVTCWSCYRSHGLKYGNPTAEELISAAETLLACKAA